MICASWEPVSERPTSRLKLRLTTLSYDQIYRLTQATYADATVNYPYDAASGLTERVSGAPFTNALEVIVKL